MNNGMNNGIGSGEIRINENTRTHYSDGSRTAKTIIYGPVKSRRFGRSLGINLSGSGKYCSFNCVYCFRGFNEKGIEIDADYFLPGSHEAISSIEGYFNYEGHDPGMLDYITIAGNGEPTDNPCLPEIIDYLFELRTRNQKLKHIKLAILTNGMGFVPAVNPQYNSLLSRIHKVDRLSVKLDSGMPDTWRRINVPGKDISFNIWFEAMKTIPDPYIQTMLINGRIDNTTEAEIERLAECYRILKPLLVYLITLDKPPADPRILPVPADKMLLIRNTLSISAPISTVI